MKKCIIEVRNLLLVLVLCFWFFNSIDTVYAQQIRWLRVGDLQSPINETGAEYESEFTRPNSNGNILSWPTQYSFDQTVLRSRGMMIGCKNFNDPVEKKVKSVKVIGTGFKAAADPYQIFPQEIKLIGKYTHPTVMVDDIAASTISSYDTLDEVDPSLPCDRMVVVKFNTSMGISVTKKVMSFANSEHGNYFIYDYVFKNTGIIDGAGTVYSQTMDSVWMYFFYRYAFAGVTSIAYNSTWGAFASQWGLTTLNHAFGEDPGATSFTDPTSPLYQLRGFYSYYGPFNGFPRSSIYEEDWGCPKLDEPGSGTLGSAKYAGCATLHADINQQNHSDDINQPKTTWFISPDISCLAATSPSQYDETFMSDRWSVMTEGHPTIQHDDLLGNTYPGNYVDSRRNVGGGVAMGQGFGPYNGLAPGDSIHIVFVEGVSGLSWEKGREVGSNWLQWHNNTGTPQLVLPDGSTTTDANLYKRKWCETGKNNILQTYRNAKQNYDAGYTVPQPPPPPATFSVESDSNCICIRLTWSNEPEVTPGFAGYDIYRAIGRGDTSYTKIASCNPGINTYADVPAIYGNNYYYYLVRRDNNGLISSKFYTMTNKPAYLTYPTLNSPSNGACLIGPPYTFTWQAVSNAGGYQIRIADNALFTSSIINDQSISGSANSYSTSTNLTYGQTYYWQIRTLNNSGTQWGVWSQYKSFVAVYQGFLTSITISTMPAPKVGISTNVNMTDQKNHFYATGHYAGNSTKDITDSCSWSSSKTYLGTIDSTGLYTFNGDVYFPPLDGSHDITATLHGITGARTIYTRLQSCSDGVTYYFYWYGTSPIATSGCTYVLGFVNGSWASYGSTGVTKEEQQPKILQLSQNYPNPFNPTTTIQYSVPRTEFVSLKIYDMLGREITTLVNENVNPGNHIIIWDASNQPSGIYFYLFYAGEYSETKRLVLLK
jgi:hypothetical protein